MGDGVTGPTFRPGQIPKLFRELVQAARAIHSDDQGDPALEAPMAALAAMVERARFADLFLASEDMTRMAVDAARDVPPMLVAEAQPSFDGALFFSDGLPPLRLEQIDGHVECSVLTWTRARGVPVLMLWVHVPDGPAAGRPTWAPVVLAEISDPDEVVDPDAFELAQSGSAYALAMSAWHLMSIPTVAQVRPTSQLGPKIGAGRTREPDRTVKVVELRRLARKAVPEEPGEDSQRVYRHQWVVRGHWRQQPIGKGRQERRTTWVPSYVKGPEGAPFLPTETVFVWRR